MKRVPSQAPRILILDDDYASMSPLKQILETLYHYQVELSAAANTVEKLRSTRYDLLCVDTMIHPKSIDSAGNEVENIHFDNINWQLTGLAFVKFLREGSLYQMATAQADNGEMDNEEKGTSTQVPIIVLSAVAHDSVEEFSITAYPNTIHMEKPFSLEDLVETMQEMMEG